MATIDFNLISIIAFYSLIAIIIFLKRKNIEIQHKVLFLYKTEKFNRVMEAIAAKAPRFWRWFGLAAVPVGFGGMALIFSYLAYKLVQLFITPAAAPSLSVVIPGVHIPGSPFIPFWYGIIALFFVIVVHEGAHGIVLAANKLRIKSSGVGLALFLPLAFVEPDEKQLMKQKFVTQAGVYAAGAFMNFVTAGLVFLLMSFIIAPIAAQAIAPSGVFLESVVEGQPAAIAGLQKGDIIIGVGDVAVTKSEDFINYMLAVKPGDTAQIRTAENQFTLQTKENPENKTRAYIGVQFKQNLDVRADLKAKFGSFPFVLFYLLNLFYWIFALNIGIGIINLLPLGPIDGGRMAKAAIDARFGKSKAMKIFGLLSYASLFLLLANLIAPYLTKAFA